MMSDIRPPRYRSLSEIVCAAADVLRPAERLTVSQAAAKYRKLHNPGAYSGDWKNEKVPYMVEPQDVLTSRDYNACVFVGGAQLGKPLHIETPVPTPDGWRPLKDIHIGDVVFSADGAPSMVTWETPVYENRDCYRLTFDDGSSVIADADHRWAVNSQRGGPDKLLVRTTAEMLEDYIIVRKSGKVRYRYCIPVAKPLQLPPATLPLDPYVLGAWLGDGHSATGGFTINAKDREHFVAEFGRRGLSVMTERFDNCEQSCVWISFRHDASGLSVRAILKNMGLLGSGQKRVPTEYLRASQEQRLDLLRGILDTDGTTAGGRVTFSQSDRPLADAVYELIVSLGFKAYRSDKVPGYVYKGQRLEGRRSYEVGFTPYDSTDCFLLDRQRAILREHAGSVTKRPSHASRRFIRKIEAVESVPVKCISVEDESHLFLVGEQMVPTHNTDALLLNWLTYSVVCDPMDMMLVNTAQATARDFSIRRVDRLHRHSPKVGELALKGNKDNVFDKHYRSGMMLSLSWPSINELSGRPVPRVALTDLDRMPENVDGEGSPFDLARKRTTTFGSSAMTLAESSPGHEVQDPRWIPSSPHEAPPCPGILALYNRGDRRRWFWPCPFCNEFFEPSFKLLQWDNTIDIVAAAESVRMMCPACRKPIEHYRKEDMNLAGRWVKEGEFIDCDGRITGNPVRSDIATFWLKGPAAAFITWQKMVLNYLLAEQEYERTGSQEALKSTVNTDQGEPYYPRGTESMRAPEEMKDRAVQAPTAQEGDKNRPLVPHGVRFLIAQVDVQANRWEVQVHGIIPNGTLYDIQVIDRFPIIKSARIDERTQEHAWVKPGTYLEDWDLVRDEVILREYELEDGSGFMAIKLVVCDSGGKEGTTANAYNFWRKLRREGLHHRFLLLKGEVKPGIPRIRIEYPDSGDKRGKEANARGEIPVLFINTNLIKDELNGRLDREDEGGGAILYPDWLEDDWFVELTGERRTDKGWVKLGSKRRNEAWDLLVYAIATCLHLGLERWDWTSVPGWAAEWPENTLVRAPEQGARFTPVETGTYDAFGRLGAALG